MTVTIKTGDSFKLIMQEPLDKFDCILTSPPYYKQRDYKSDSDLGQEGTVEDYIANLVTIFGIAALSLKPTGTLWLNLGDKYIDKRLQGIPWRVALALQESSSYILRSAIIWKKPNVRPDGATDRPTGEYEHIFLLSVNEKYFYDADAIREDPADYYRAGGSAPYSAGGMNNDGSSTLHQMSVNGRNARNIWTFSTAQSPEEYEHYATMPLELAKRCLKAGCPPGGHVLDLLAGTGTTGLAADRLGMDATLFEINPKYSQIAYDRIYNDAPLLVDIVKALKWEVH